MNFENIRYRTEGPVAVITYDRQARRNAMHTPMYREMVAAVEAANADTAVGAIVITNEGPVFCAGSDNRSPPEPRDPVTGQRPSVPVLGMADDTSWLHLLRRSKPSVAAINGAAIGLGVTHVLAADIRIGSASSTYSFPFLALSTMPEFGCTALLPRLVGFGRAIDIMLTSQKLDAAEALRIGLVTRVSPDDSVMADAMALAGQLAAIAPLQMKLTRAMIYDNDAEHDLNAILTRERAAFVTLFRAARAAAAEGAKSEA